MNTACAASMFVAAFGTLWRVVVNRYQ